MGRDTETSAVDRLDSDRHAAVSDGSYPGVQRLIHVDLATWLSAATQPADQYWERACVQGRRTTMDTVVGYSLG